MVKEAKMLLWSTLILVISAIAAFFIAKLFSKEKNTAMAYTYAFTIPNIAYIGYPLMSAVFGDDMMFEFMVFALPFQVYIFCCDVYAKSQTRV